MIWFITSSLILLLVFPRSKVFSSSLSLASRKTLDHALGFEDFFKEGYAILQSACFSLKNQLYSTDKDEKTKMHSRSKQYYPIDYVN